MYALSVRAEPQKKTSSIRWSGVGRKHGWTSALSRTGSSRGRGIVQVSVFGRPVKVQGWAGSVWGGPAEGRDARGVWKVCYEVCTTRYNTPIAKPRSLWLSGLGGGPCLGCAPEVTDAFHPPGETSLRPRTVTFPMLECPTAA